MNPEQPKISSQKKISQLKTAATITQVLTRRSEDNQHRIYENEIIKLRQALLDAIQENQVLRMRNAELESLIVAMELYMTTNMQAQQQSHEIRRTQSNKISGRAKSI